MGGQTKEKDRQEYRRKRVRFIKRSIIFIIIASIVIPTALSVYLMYKVRMLQYEVERLSQAKVQKKSEANVVQAQTKKKPVIEEPKKVYLTFDDGPSQQTSRILDVLKKENVKATFFVVGHTDRFSQKMYRRIVNEGHTLGMHSYSHIYSELYRDSTSFEKDVDKIQNYLKKVTKTVPEFYRFPGGSSYSDRQVSIEDCIGILNQKGISYMDWNVIDGDDGTTQSSKEQIVSNILTGVSAFKTSIVQMHDSSDKRRTADVLKKLIPELKEQKYEILPIDENTTPIRHVE